MSAQEPLRILSFGAGALGTYIGGSLALAGHKLVFLERPAVAEQLKQQGLHLKLEERQYTLANPVTAGRLEEALELGEFDVALFALKAYDTAGALAEIEPFAARMPPLVCLQNGVENEIALARVLGAEKVIAGTVTSAVGRRNPGDIILERKRGSGLAANHPLAHTLAEAFNEAGLNTRLYARAADMKWSKMLTNLLTNATSAILDLAPEEVISHPGLYRLEVAQLREALRVMQAENIQVVDLPGTPVRALALAARSLPGTLGRKLLGGAVGKGRGDKRPSFYLDLHSGRGKSEVDFLNGAVVRYGARHDIPTPVNRFLTETLLALTRGEYPLDTYAKTPEKLIRASPLGA